MGAESGDGNAPDPFRPIAPPPMVPGACGNENGVPLVPA